MHDVGDILGGASRAEVGVVPQENHLLTLGHTLWIKPLLGQHRQCHGIDLDRTQRTDVVATPPRILVDKVDKSSHRGDAVAGHHWRPTMRRGDHAAADDENPVIGPRHEPLDDNGRRLGPRDVPGAFDLFAGGDVD